MASSGETDGSNMAALPIPLPLWRRVPASSGSGAAEPASSPCESITLRELVLRSPAPPPAAPPALAAAAWAEDSSGASNKLRPLLLRKPPVPAEGDDEAAAKAAVSRFLPLLLRCVSISGVRGRSPASAAEDAAAYPPEGLARPLEVTLPEDGLARPLDGLARPLAGPLPVGVSRPLPARSPAEATLSTDDAGGAGSSNGPGGGGAGGSRTAPTTTLPLRRAKPCAAPGELLRARRSEPMLLLPPCGTAAPAAASALEVGGTAPCASGDGAARCFPARRRVGSSGPDELDEPAFSRRAATAAAPLDAEGQPAAAAASDKCCSSSSPSSPPSSPCACPSPASDGSRSPSSAAPRCWKRAAAVPLRVSAPLAAPDPAHVACHAACGESSRTETTDVSTIVSPAADAAFTMMAALPDVLRAYAVGPYLSAPSPRCKASSPPVAA